VPRSRETIMAEWDAVRTKIAGGCTNSGPRDWFEGVMDEQDHIIADLIREVSRLRSFEDALRKHQHWNDEAKRAAGYHVNVSFDDVWADALAALLEKRKT
jgi:hypothetical protein